MGGLNGATYSVLLNTIALKQKTYFTSKMTMKHAKCKSFEKGMFDLQFAGLMRQFLTYKNVSASKLKAKDLFCFKKENTNENIFQTTKKMWFVE